MYEGLCSRRRRIALGPNVVGVVVRLLAVVRIIDCVEPRVGGVADASSRRRRIA